MPACGRIPSPAAADAAIQCQVSLQRAAGGNALVGRQVYPLLVRAGFSAVRVSPRMVYVDASRPALVDGFTRKTFTAMIEGVRQPALAAGLITAERFDAGIDDLQRTAAADGVFCYTFFKGVGGEPRRCLSHAGTRYIAPCHGLNPAPSSDHHAGGCSPIFAATPSRSRRLWKRRT